MAVQTPVSLRNRFNIDVRVNTRVVHIDTKVKTVSAINETNPSSNTEEFTYDQLVLAVGSEPLKPPIPGINRPGLFALRNLDDMDRIVAWLATLPLGKEKPHAVVAGAGFVGLEMVEQLMRRGLEVTVVEMLPQVLGPLDVEMAAIIEAHIKAKGVNLITGNAIQEFLPADRDERSTVVKLKSGKMLPPAALTILGMGVRPDTKIISDAGIECGSRGHIIVDDHMHTNVTDVWAAGDAVEVRNPIAGNDEKWAVPLAGPANRQGRLIADNIYGMNRTFKGTFGASVVRIFELVAACVGMNEKMLVQMGLPFACVHVHPGSHAGYFPGAKR